MILNLLDINRSEEGKLIPQPQAINLMELFEQLGRNFRARLQVKEQRMETDCQLEGAPTISADKDLLVRLLSNLLDNSLRYAPIKGCVRLLASRDGPRLRIEVSDDGPGVPDVDKDHIFEKYIQLDGDHLRTSRGLGLVFCRLAAEAHGGRIWVEDRRPTGSAFCILLPSA
jgi:two-component system, sensor histidine kinase and response regulator